VLNRKLLTIAAEQSTPAGRGVSRLDLLRGLPDLPVLSETLLLMELMLQGQSVNLTGVSQLILSDLGAALQVMRLAGLESSSVASLPRRIEDCVSGLGLDACLDAMSKRPVSRSARHSGLLQIWTHAHEIADLCRSLAEETRGKVSPSDAFLVGLCHELGELPAALGWDWPREYASNPDTAGLKLAEAWSLPTCILEYFFDRQAGHSSSQWVEIVDRAHLLALADSNREFETNHPVYEANAVAWLHAVSS